MKPEVIALGLVDLVEELRIEPRRTVSCGGHEDANAVTDLGRPVATGARPLRSCKAVRAGGADLHVVSVGEERDRRARAMPGRDGAPGMTSARGSIRRSGACLPRVGSTVPSPGA